jgi:hypothetical protein
MYIRFGCEVPQIHNLQIRWILACCNGKGAQIPGTRSPWQLNFVQTDIVETNYTAVIVQSSNIYYKQDYGHMFRLALVIFKPMPDDCKFLYLNTAVCTI